MTFDDSDQLLRDGNQFLALGQLDAAELCFLRLLSTQPDHVGAQANLGWIRERQGALAEAEQHYRAALALRPDHVQLQLNLCVLLLKTRRLVEGEQLARQLVVTAPDSVAAWSQLGVLLACLQRGDEAEQCYRHALALAQDAESSESAEQARVRFNLSYVLMRQGRWAEGWPLLESRWQFDHLPQWFDCPRWQGEPLAGKSLAIGLEAGQGDMIHFCRYAALAKAEGAARIGVVCHPSLKTLFASMDGIDVAYAYDEAVPREGWGLLDAADGDAALVRHHARQHSRAGPLRACRSSVVRSLASEFAADRAACRPGLARQFRHMRMTLIVRSVHSMSSRRYGLPHWPPIQCSVQPFISSACKRMPTRRMPQVLRWICPCWISARNCTTLLIRRQ